MRRRRRPAGHRGATDLRRPAPATPARSTPWTCSGKAWGSGILAADAAKGALACAVGRRLAGATGAHVAGTAAVVGHCFPVWNGFRGGKGVAVSLGHCAATFPAYVPVDLAWPGRRRQDGPDVPRHGGGLGGLGGGRRAVVAQGLAQRVGAGADRRAARSRPRSSSAVIAYKFLTGEVPGPVA